MKVLKPGVTKTASVNMTVNPVGETYVLALTFAKNGSIVSQSYEREFVGTGTPQYIGVDVVAPSIQDDYHLFVDIYLKRSMGDTPVYQQFGQWVSWDVIRVYELADVYEAYNPKAYFDDEELESYVFEAGTRHKITVEFTNPYDKSYWFYLNDYNKLPGLKLYQELQNFSVGAGARAKKNVEFVVGDSPMVVGPLDIKIHCLQSGLTGPVFATSPITIIENPTVIAGSIDVVPEVTSIGQGEYLKLKVRITNPTNKAWAYGYTMQLDDKDGNMISGFITNLSVPPFSTGESETYGMSMLREWEKPPAGTATFKAKFLGQTHTLRSIAITTKTMPASKVAYVSKQWFRWVEQNNTLMLRVNLKNNTGKALDPWGFDNCIWATHRTEGWVFEAGLYPDGWYEDWPAGATKPFLSGWWDMGSNPGTYDVVMGLKSYDHDIGAWCVSGMSYPVSLGSYTVT